MPRPVEETSGIGKQFMMCALVNRTVFRTTAIKNEPRTACELLAEGTGLSKIRIKDAMQKGRFG